MRPVTMPMVCALLGADACSRSGGRDLVGGPNVGVGAVWGTAIPPHPPSGSEEDVTLPPQDGRAVRRAVSWGLTCQRVGITVYRITLQAIATINLVFVEKRMHGFLTERAHSPLFSCAYGVS